MKKIILFLLMMFAANAQAADQKKTYYSYPDAATMPDNGRIQMYDPALGSLNVTGLTLRTTPSDTPLTAQPISGDNPYKRVAEFKDSTGKITSYIQANGTMVLGTPVALAVSAVYPANGATGVAIDAVPYVTFNKAVYVRLSTTYIQGDSTAPAGNPDTPGQPTQTWTIPATLAAGTTYTIKVVKNNIPQTDGETTSSCGTTMTDNAGVCESTFTTAP